MREEPGPQGCPWELAVCGDCLDWLILQAPYAAVFEGEPLVLRCRGWYDQAVHKLRFYQDGRALRSFPAGANYTVPQARAGDSGRYQCSGTLRLPAESAPVFSAEVAVTVQGRRGPGRDAQGAWGLRAGHQARGGGARVGQPPGRVRFPLLLRGGGA